MTRSFDRKSHREATEKVKRLHPSERASAADCSLGLRIIGRLLSHTQAATTARYSHVAIDPAKRAADFIAGQIPDG
ncbi:hypothetical protein [Bradyrhizobium japonicum]|uniref:hypothetical protein n=1 Tax=Bradyrhizobium japonicum TaxID=375 RepID=UPI00041568C0|nr:hypothetical protein [Bradyrhizobium japonicum]MCP1860310.1 hypothetical protein [Bradyrhizobium japonicum]